LRKRIVSDSVGSRGQPRTSLSVPRDVGDQFTAQADRAGKILYSFASEWLDAASKISARGGTAKGTLELWNLCSMLRDAEVIPLPADFVEGLISDLYAVDKESVRERFHKMGSGLVSLLKIAAPNVEELALLAKEFAGFIPAKRIEIKRTGNKSLMVNVVGAGRRFETTECSFEFVRAVLKGYGYSVVSQDLGIGTIRIQCAMLEV
jgi:hypothetical protein